MLMDNPYILDETEDFAVVFKPPKMHSTVKSKEQITENKEVITLLNWFKSQSASVFDIMHRLDYETNGLVLFAKNEKSYLFFKEGQENGAFIKEYSAVCIKNNEQMAEGFPPFPVIENLSAPFVIKSYFRPFGPGRKLVRPVVDSIGKHKKLAKDNGGFYKTEIVNINDNTFTVRIKRGFRHQIRCHLCWVGFPIVNDPLYSGCVNEERIAPDSIMSLRSQALFFPDPSGGNRLVYRIDAKD